MRSTAALVALLSAALVLSTSFSRDGGPGVLGGDAATVAPAPVDWSGVRMLLRGHPGPVRAGEADDMLIEHVSVVSAPQPLPEAIIASVTGLDGVLATTRVRSAAIGLFGSFAADGTPRDVPPSGMRIPINAVAIDPHTYLDVITADVDEQERSFVSSLAPGTVLLSASAARLRDLDAGATVDVGRAEALVVAGVVSDGVARGSDVLVHVADVDRVGVGTRESLLVRTAVPASGPTLATRFDDALDDALGGRDEDGDEVRVWHGTRQVPLVLSMTALKERFGEFAFRFVPNQREVGIERRFVDEWITVERMPVLGNVRCHRLIMDDLRAAIEETVAAGFSEWLAPSRYGGCFHPRRIGFGRENLSRHTWGIAIDLNVDFSLPGAGPVPPDAFIEIWGRHGFRWGGDFSTPDNHHFEWVGEAAQVRPRRDGI